MIDLAFGEMLAPSPHTFLRTKQIVVRTMTSQDSTPDIMFIPATDYCVLQRLRLWRRDGALLEKDIIDQGRSRFDQALSIIKAHALLSICKFRRNNGLNFLANHHTRHDFIKTTNHRPRTNFEQERVRFAFGVGGVKYLPIYQISRVVNCNDITAKWRDCFSFSRFLCYCIFDPRRCGDDFLGSYSIRLLWLRHESSDGCSSYNGRERAGEEAPSTADSTIRCGRISTA
mmetsp:Transcript_33770/g.71989  ORF Transcript_33770/g.71989 Transcript_33770/m.71989 type:complete len:229 (+) Transcript_33770:177-863(+)